MNKAIVLLSGGLDSATTTAIALQQGYEVIALSFRYGQRHVKELDAAKKVAQYFQIKQHYIVDINLAQWGGSALTDSQLSLPQTGVDPNIIPLTYVPGRNTVFIATALSLAEAEGAEAIFLGINAVDYSGYPDCRPEYLEAYQKLAKLASKAGIEGKAPQLIAPLITLAKTDIVRLALKLQVPIELTWSCYQGETNPCGLCDSCRIRDQALIAVGREDLASQINMGD